MKIIKIVLITILLALKLNAVEYAGIQMDNQGLVTNIVPCYRSPILSDQEDFKIPSMSQIRAEESEEKLTKYVVDLKKWIQCYRTRNGTSSITSANSYTDKVLSVIWSDKFMRRNGQYELYCTS